ncbi:CARDB domain-containing protein [Natronorubrum sp. A-ect3]|uniref:CARDB domain-containing protein n=1 Tax=Natronorubrum sp. A-ect3 TaxID=3242698 RepID=UPI00359D830A
MTQHERLITAIFLVAIMLLAPIAGVAGASGGAGTTADASSTDHHEDEFHEIHENIEVWERSVVPLRTDTAADGSISVENLNLEMKTNQGGPDSVNRKHLAVYSTGTTIDLSFDGSGFAADTSQFNNDDDIQLLSAHLQENATEDDVNVSDLPTSGQELMDELSAENLENLNENVSFSLDEDLNEDLNVEDGKLDTTVTPDESGLHMYMLATGDGFAVDDGDLSIVDQTKIIGVEQLVAQDSPSDVDVTDSAEPGDTISFDVAATEWEGNTTHSVVLYDEDTFTSSWMTINVTEDISTDLSSEDVTIEHTIGEINGVQNVSENLSAFGQTFEERNSAGIVQTADVISFLANETDLDDSEGPETDPGDDVLNASSAIVQADENETTVEIETFGNWTEDDYRWIHTAAGSSSDQIQMNTDTITIEEEAEPGPGPGPGPIDPGPDPDPEFALSDVSVSDTKIMTGDSVDITGTITEEAGNSGLFVAELIIDGEVVDTQNVVMAGNAKETVTFTHTFDEAGEYEVAINDVSAGTVSVHDSLEAQFDVTDASLSEDEIDVGDSVDVTGTIENTGEKAGTVTAQLTVDGSVVAEQDVTVAPGESETVTFTETFDESGEFEIAVSGTSAGTLTVTDPEDVETDDSIPGFGVTVAVLALLSIALVRARRQS